jgi:heme iron utilization protein
MKKESIHLAEFNKLELRKKISGLLSEQKLATLATRDEKNPYNTLVAFTFTEDLKFILFATGKDTRKYQNILRYPYVSLLIDNRTNDNKDFKDAVALTILAKVKQSEKQTYLYLYLNRFPDLKEFLENPQTALVLLEIQQYIYVYRFQEILELKMK